MSRINNGTTYVACFITGAGIGAITALLFAPRSGKETRRYLAQKADNGREFVTTKGRELRRQAEGYAEKGREFMAKFA